MSFQGDSIFWVEVEKIVPNPFQPRREFDEAKLQELADSVRMYGILQPLTVTRKEVSREDGTFFSEYELIAGERRLRASKLAGLAQVPVIIREGENNEQEKLELAIIENLQREDLNAVDRGLAFKQLAEAFNLTHAQVAKKVGRSREYVSNTLRLLTLPEYMLDSLKKGDISEGHARTLLMLSDRPEELDTVYREILLKKLSVREVERIARKIASDKVRKKTWQNTDPTLIEIEKQFTESLGTRVQIAKTDYGGKITIDYFSEEDLTGLLERLRNENRGAIASAAAVVAVDDELSESAREEQEILDDIVANTPLESIEKDASPSLSQPPQTHTVHETDTPRPDSSAETRRNEEQSVLPDAQEQPEMVRDPAPVFTPATVSAGEQVEEPSVPIREQHFVDPNNITTPEPDESDMYAVKNFGV